MPAQMQKVLIIDFGSQYTQLIARRVRELKVYCEIWPCTEGYEKIKNFCAKAIILSGGPASVLQKDAPTLDPRVLDLEVPVLGICYGMQLLTKMMGGKVVRSEAREYGHAAICIRQADTLLKGVGRSSAVWMSHGDSIKKLPHGFKLLAVTTNGVPAAICHTSKKIAALQFHPEVHHTSKGRTILKNFLFGMARVRADWNMHDFINHQLCAIRERVKNDHVILGLSGGVDSSVAAILIHKAIGSQLTCIFVNNGLLRHNEYHQVQEVFTKNFKITLRPVDASKEFLKKLGGVSCPEKKRKIIGRTFIKVFTREAKKIKGVKFLAQGTLYPDVIESVSFKGPSAVIKSHHNVGGLPKRMGLKLIEPLRELFKDEVRALGRQLKMPAALINRHPFPGPGLGIRILGPVTPDKVKLLQRADHIAIEEIKNAGWYDKIWQAFVVLLPVRSVGVMGDERTYEYTAALRAVSAVDGMTADWVELPHGLLSKISGRIISEVKGINRVVYDISSKPPATIEWE
ncbi:MAG: glutamine-hydrolyzing GMP synthase [Deltaproteobacteria bacterium]|nr:glutamine-hydrolyzing GMP synthase [Deltaproteobacteria bacterium]